MCGKIPLFGDAVTFYNDYFIFKLIWQINDDLFNMVIDNIKKHKVKFELVTCDIHQTYRDYFIELFNSNRRCDFYPEDIVLGRWQELLNAMEAPDGSIDKILRFFPSHVKHCSEVIFLN